MTCYNVHPGHSLVRVLFLPVYILLLLSSSVTTTPQPFYGPFSGTTRVSQCQKRTSGLYGARED